MFAIRRETFFGNTDFSVLSGKHAIFVMKNIYYCYNSLQYSDLFFFGKT